MTERSITPLPVGSGAREVLLFGGVFDPPHWAHVELAIAARDAVMGEGAWLVYVPAARSPHKPDGPVASNEDRVAMLRLATSGRARVGIWTDELDRADEGPSLWVETVERARRVLDPEATLRFLIGADQAVAFHRWHEARRILELAEPVVMLRDPAPDGASLRERLRETGAWSEDEVEWWAGRVVEHEAMSMSSTQVRRRLAAGEPIESLDARVRAYIAEHGLYVT